jgi:glucosylglycerate synthase
MDHAQESVAPKSEPRKADAADLAIGVITPGGASAVDSVVKIVRDGLAAHFAGLTAAIIHVDGSLADDGTGQVEQIGDGLRLVHAHPSSTLPSTDEGSGWSEGLRTVLGLAREQDARALVLLNAEIISMTPEWIRCLAEPVLKDGCGFVLPVYQRGRYEGTLTQLFVVPLLRALFGRQLSYPIADEFACSVEAAEFVLAQDVWSTDIARQGLEFWLPVALSEPAFHVAQSVLGPRAVSSQRPPAPLGPTVGRVAGALFAIAERHEASWLDVRGSEPVPVIGISPGPAAGTLPRSTPIDPERMLVGFRQGMRDLLPIWERILAPDNLGDVLTLSEYPAGEFRLADRLWARVVYDFLLAYRARVMYRSHITQSLAPLYLGRAASLVLETRLRPDAAVAQATERLARVFEDEKPYLVDRWR